MAQLKDTVISGNLRVTNLILTDSIKISDGTSSQFLKADGSIDSNTYALASAIPSAVTETTVTNWGFTKNTGTLTGVTFNGTAATVTDGIAAITANVNGGGGASGTLNTNVSTAQSVSSSESFDNNISLHKISKTGTYTDLISKPVLKTTNTTAQTTNASETISGTINLHKVAKTGTYSDLIGTPTIPTKVSDLTNDSGFTSNAGTITEITMNGSSKGTSGVVNLGTVVTSETDPIFSASAAAGITSSDITNWNSKTSNTGTITGITMNGASKGTSGVVDLGTVITSHATHKLLIGTPDSPSQTLAPGQALNVVTGLTGTSTATNGDLTVTPVLQSIYLTSNPGTIVTNNTTAQTASASESLAGTINLHKVAKTGTYSDLIGTPTIPTESTVSGWGFTKNAGTLTGVKVNGSNATVTSGIADIGTVLTSETSLSKGTTSGSGNVVTDISVSGHQITLTKGSFVPVATSGNSGKIPRITSAGGWEYVTPSAIYSGSGTPSNSLGNEGDIYIQSS